MKAHTTSGRSSRPGRRPPAAGPKPAPASRTGSPPQSLHGNQEALRLLDRAGGHEPRNQRRPAPVAQEAIADAGQPLDAATRVVMEQRLGRSFSDVRIHIGPHSAERADAVQAAAYTVGKHIVFNDGLYQPGTAQGQQLLAHELAHVAQPRATGAESVSKPGDASELEAERAARTVATGGVMRVGASAGAPIQRQAFPGVMPGKLDPPSPDALYESASPLLASALGSATLDGFDTGKSALKGDHVRTLDSLAHAVTVLLRKYGTSTLDVTGFADTVGEEAKNLTLGQDRADVVKEALIKRGVPEGIINATSRGEGGPQAVKTKNEVPSAANRRVDIRFHPGKSRPGILGGTLTMPDPNKPVPKPFSPFDVDIFPKPGTTKPGPEPQPLPPNYFKPIPPPIKGSGPKSVIDVIGEKIIDPVVDAVAGGLSKEKRAWLKEKARDAVESGIPAAAKAAAKAAGVTDSEAIEAIEKSVEAAIKEKGQGEKGATPK